MITLTETGASATGHGVIVEAVAETYMGEAGWWRVDDTSPAHTEQHRNEPDPVDAIRGWLRDVCSMPGHRPDAYDLLLADLG